MPPAAPYLLRELLPGETPPWPLLLLADPKPASVAPYLERGTTYVAEADGQVDGVCVLDWRLPDEVEVCNLAVHPSAQGRGLGRALLAYAETQARLRGAQRLRVCTGNSSLQPLALYQKAGFDLLALRRNYFTEHYPEPIWENGIQCRHLLILEKNLAGALH